jgi:hypothetical protein
MRATQNFRYLAIMLTACLFFTGSKMPPIFFHRLDPIHFFPRLPETTNNVKIDGAEATKINQINNPTNIINEHQANFYVKGNLTNLKFEAINNEWAKDLSTSPAFDEQNIFTLKNRGHIKCYNKNTKQLNWQYQIILPTKEHEFSTVSIQDKYLIVTVKNTLFVFDKENGREVMFKTLASRIISSPAISKHGILNVQTADIYYQFDINYKRELNRKYGSHTNLVQQTTISPILYKDGVLTTHTDNKITYSSCDINKINQEFLLPKIISEMELLQSKLPSKLRSVACQPILSDDNLFVVSTHKKLMKYDLKNQTIVWQIPIPGIMKIFKVKNTIFSTGYANQIIAIDADSGKILWVKSLPYKKSDLNVGAFMANGKIVVCSKMHKKITLITNDGKIEKQITLPKLPANIRILSIMPVNDELILFTSKKSIKLVSSF